MEVRVVDTLILHTDTLEVVLIEVKALHHERDLSILSIADY